MFLIFTTSNTTTEARSPCCFQTIRYTPHLQCAQRGQAASLPGRSASGTTRKTTKEFQTGGSRSAGSARGTYGAWLSIF